MPKATIRFDALAAARVRPTPGPGAAGNGGVPAFDVEEIFGENTFGLEEMRTRLPKQVFRALLATIERGVELDPAHTDAVAIAMKEWATEKGVTHFTHWFQPLTRLDGGKARLFHYSQRRRGRGCGVQRQGT